MKISCDDDSEKQPMASPELNLINNAKLEGLSHPVQVIAVTGGKGGVGKTSVSVNLATAMAAAGKRVVLFDGDLGLANADGLNQDIIKTRRPQHICHLNSFGRQPA